jgi:NAD+-dependent secondary alcohol dehydrogenase Adh1
MKAARLHQYDPTVNTDLKLDTVPVPKIGAADHVIVRVGAAGLCRTDLHIIEGILKPDWDPAGTLLPYTLGHENAGWVEEIGSGVTTVKPGDTVICHPLRTCGVCYGCRRGEDMYCERSLFPGINADGGFAEYLLTNERACIKLNPNVLPVDCAPLADAGITAYRAAKRAAKSLQPGSYTVVLGIGGLGHIALQALHALCATRTIAIDKSPAARQLATECGAQHVLDGSGDVCAQVRDLTHGGAHAVLDLVGERGAEQLCWQMLRKGGTHYVVGYGGQLDTPTAHMVVNEITISGVLVGNYMELVELMELHAEGRVKLHGQQYRLGDINRAIDDFKNGRIAGRGVIVP